MSVYLLSSLFLFLSVHRCLSNDPSDTDILFITGGFGSEAPKLQRYTKNGYDSFITNYGTRSSGSDPSTLTLNSRHRVIYTAINDVDSRGAITATKYSLDNNWIDTTSSIQYSLSTYPSVWLSIDSGNHFVYSASYGASHSDSSGFQIFRVDPNSGFFSPSTPIVDHAVSDERSRTHCINPHPNDFTHFYVADNGLNALIHYELIQESGPSGDRWSYEQRSLLNIESPRTLAFHPTKSHILYISQEEPHHVSVVKINESTFKLDKILQTMTTVPNDPGYEGVTVKPSHVNTDRDGKYLYVANRDKSSWNTGGIGNNIAVFRLDSNGEIMTDSLQISSCGGNIPRHFQVDPSNQYMFICDQFGENEGGWPGKKGQLAILKIDHDNGGILKLENTYNYQRLGYNEVGLSWVQFLSDAGWDGSAVK